jgi:hypothetical protein
MEASFEWSFAEVRVFSDAAAAASARAVNARAYTVGSRVVFGSGGFQPGTARGERLLAHELAHVVQQTGKAPDRVASATESEQDAEHAATECLQGATSLRSLVGTSPIGLAAAPDTPTFGNLGEPLDRYRSRSVLVEENGTWRELRPDGAKWRADGTYAFVTQKGKIWAVKPTDAVGADGPGHRDAAAGGRVEFAGMARFRKGELREWTNAAGHIKPAAGPLGEDQQPAFAKAAGLPMDKFRPFEGPREPGGPQAQLPVVQPAKPATPPAASEEPATTASPRSEPARASPPARAPTSGPSAPASRPAPPGAAEPSPTSEAKPARATGSTGRLTVTVPSEPPPPTFGPSPKGEAIGGAIVLALEAIHAILDHFADKKQRARADEAWQREWPKIQETINATGRGVVVYVEYTRYGESSILVFEGLHWTSGGVDFGPPGAIRSQGQHASFSRAYIAPTKEQAGRFDVTALEFRRDQLRDTQKVYQQAAERMSKEGRVGRFLLDRAGTSIDPKLTYDARAHIVSAGEAIKQGRYADASRSLDLAEEALDTMLKQFDAYMGPRKLTEPN